MLVQCVRIPLTAQKALAAAPVCLDGNKRLGKKQSLQKDHLNVSKL